MLHTWFVSVSPVECQKETFSVCHSCVPRPPPSLTGHLLRTDPTDECGMALYPPFRAVGCQRDTMAPFPSHPHSLPPPLLFRLKKVLKCHIPDPSEFFSQLKSEHGGDFQVGVWSWRREGGIWLRLAGGRPEVWAGGEVVGLRQETNTKVSSLWAGCGSLSPAWAPLFSG